MQEFKSIAALRDSIFVQKKGKKTTAFVPTMGALHEGHRSCVEVARGLGDLLVISIFVNPTQFGPGEDLDSYPVTLNRDLEHCAKWGCDAVFLPSIEDIYQGDQVVWIDPGPLAQPLCGRTRPGHFRGVATVVAKLFNIVEPDVAVFGQKDAQQALVIREMARQLNFPIEIRLSPTVREPDGLACSSRNAYLTKDQRAQAGGLHAALQAGREILATGERDAERVGREVRRRLKERGIDRVEYVELIDSETLAPVGRATGRMLLAAAVRVGETRLIDNLVLEVGEGRNVTETLLY